LKSWILDGLEGSLQGLLRNGHLHKTRLAGCPAGRIMVMVETQFSPESRDPRQPIRVRWIREGLRRLRFPSFYSLFKERPTTTPHDRPSEDDFLTTMPRPEDPDLNLGLIESVMPEEGGEAARAPQRRRNKYHPSIIVNSVVKKCCPNFCRIAGSLIHSGFRAQTGVWTTRCVGRPAAARSSVAPY
jgi:hypothetical protein